MISAPGEIIINPSTGQQYVRDQGNNQGLLQPIRVILQPPHYRSQPGPTIMLVASNGESDWLMDAIDTIHQMNPLYNVAMALPVNGQTVPKQDLINWQLNHLRQADVILIGQSKQCSASRCLTSAFPHWLATEANQPPMVIYLPADQLASSTIRQAQIRAPHSPVYCDLTKAVSHAISLVGEMHPLSP